MSSRLIPSEAQKSLSYFRDEDTYGDILGKRPDVSHFRIFGSPIFCHVTKDAWKKLDPTTELGILVGYMDTPHNYRVFLPAN